MRGPCLPNLFCRSSGFKEGIFFEVLRFAFHYWRQQARADIRGGLALRLRQLAPETLLRLVRVYLCRREVLLLA